MVFYNIENNRDKRQIYISIWSLLILDKKVSLIGSHFEDHN